MVAKYTNIKKFRDFLGVDLKSTDIKRGYQFASGGQDADFTPNNSIVKRRGYQYKANSGFNAGLVTYARVDDDGIPAPELISIGPTLRKRVQSSVDISYTGLVEGRLEFVLDGSSSTFVFRLVEDNIEKLRVDCGDGIDTVVTITDLINQVNALGNWTASTSGDPSQPAAYLEIIREEMVEVGTPRAMAYIYFVDINSGTVSMTASTSEQGMGTWENPSFVNLNNVLYISNKTDGLFKYDGQTFYKAGMPTGEPPVAAIGGAGALTGTYIYAQTYLQVDRAGQVIEGNLSVNSNTVTPTADAVDVTLENIQSSSGFNTNAAIVAGAQALVTTITVDNGSGGSHSLQVGDTAYFYDGVTSLYVERRVSARTPTSITIEGDAVTVVDNAVISNNLRIALYRTVDSGVAKYLIAEIPNNPYAASQVYADNTADAGLGPIYVTPRYGHDEPPKGQYLAVYRNLLIVAGSKTSPSRVYWSDSDGPEYFPAASHAVDCNTKIGDVINGIGANNDQLFIGKEQSIFLGGGDFANLNFAMNQLTSGDLGCVSHASIQEVREGVLYFLTSRGPYQIIGGQLPTPVGAMVSDSGQLFSRIETFFTDINQDADFLPKLRRAVAVNWPAQAKYVLFIPSEDDDGTAAANENSTVWVFDYSRGAWLPKWTHINAAGGLAVFDEVVYWTARTTTTLTANFLDTNDEYDFADHTAPIEFVYEDSWEHLGEPNIDKKYLRLVMMVLDEIESASWDLTVEMGVEFYKDIIWSSATVPFGDSDSVGWGEGSWGDLPWGEPLNSTKTLKLKSNKTKAARMIFRNADIHKNVLLTGWEIEVATPYEDLR